MKSHEDGHLSEDRILWSFVDEAALPTADREHLSECAECRLAVAQVRDSLTAFTEFAQRASPKPSRRPSVPREVHISSSWVSHWRGPFLTGFATATLLLLISGILFQRNLQTDGLARLHEEMIQDQILIAEIDRLEENALPPAYLEISDGNDPDSDLENLEEDKARFEGQGKNTDTVRRFQREWKKRS
ncbi:MAG: hypothetical protein KBH99_04225 [Syntrophobacteraceae bacterium]|nr:hypothetical protein [Syntrophobacteraceae bacterium]